MSENPLLLDIMKYMFYAIDLNLYLDNFPKNHQATEDYKMVSEKLDCLVKQYEQTYGPLTNFGSSSMEDPEKWTSCPWPWENK